MSHICRGIFSVTKFVDFVFLFPFAVRSFFFFFFCDTCWAVFLSWGAGGGGGGGGDHDDDDTDKMFAYNYCPLTFMSSSGGNITPDK